MADIDFIVHPIHAEEWYSGETIFESHRDAYNRYIDSLEKVVRTSNYVVLIETFEERDSYFCDVPKENILLTDYIPDDDKKEMQHTGFLIDNDWDNLLDILSHAGVNKKSDIRVHGSYINECVSQFANQLALNLSLGIHAYNFSNSPIRSYLDFKLINPVAETLGLFRSTNIRYGMTLSPCVVHPDVNFNPEGPSITKPFGDYQFQLYDEINTRLFF